MTVHTPWGTAQHSERYAEGVIFYSTASHGGFHLDEKKLAEMPTALRAIKPYAGEGWYEEDEDWTIVALAFPELFTDWDVHCAVRTAYARWRGKERFPEAIQWLQSDAKGAELHARVVAWRRSNGHFFEMGSAGTCGKGWTVRATRIDRSEHIVIDFPEAPARDAAGNWQGYYALASPFEEARVAQLGGRIVEREPLDTTISVAEKPLSTVATKEGA